MGGEETRKIQGQKARTHDGKNMEQIPRRRAGRRRGKITQLEKDGMKKTAVNWRKVAGGGVTTGLIVA